MKMNIYAIRDAKVDAFAQPFFSQTHGAAIRAFTDHVNENGTAANKHPDDFILHHIGTYDDATGEITSTKPTALGIAAEYLQRNTNQVDISEAIARAKAAKKGA